MFKKFTQGIVVLFISLWLSACSDHAQPLPQLSTDQLNQLITARGNTALGNPQGNVTVVEFFDYQCPYCRKMTPMLQQFAQQDPKVKIVFKEYILFGPDSEPLTRAALAAQKQGQYLAMHNLLLTTDHALSEKDILQLAALVKINSKQLAKDMRSKAVSDQIDENNQLARKLNLDAAPTFIVIANNNPQKALVWVGELSAAKLEALVQRVRQ